MGSFTTQEGKQENMASQASTDTGMKPSLGLTGVTINALAPAVIRTPLVEATPPDVVEAMLSRIPMGRPGELSEVAAMLAMIASPDCSYTTGFTFDLSGGRATY